MRQHKNIIFTVCILHRKRHHMMCILRKYGSSFMYSVKSCIHPIFHFRLKPRPSSSGDPVTFGHAVDSSAIITAPLFRPRTTEFKCLKKSIASRFSLPPYLFATHCPSCFRNQDRASTQQHPHGARPHGNVRSRIMRLQSGSCALPLFRNQILSFPNPDVLRVWDLHTRMSEFRQNQQAREHLSENAPEPSQESLLYCFMQKVNQICKIFRTSVS